MNGRRLWMGAIRGLLPAALLGLLLPPGVPAESPLPIFDAHVHYSESAWDNFPPAVVAQKLAAAGVPRALVSSSPDDGTLRLREHEPVRFQPVLRPYRAGVGLSNWSEDPATPDYLRERLARGGYAGIGEFHLHDAAQVRTPVVRAVARLAVEHGIVLHVHAGAAPVQAFYEIQPDVRILWAHAGMSTPPADVRVMMERHPNLWAELSFREYEIGRGGTLDATWAALLTDHPERFLVGSDTYVPDRWDEYSWILSKHREYLALLPPAVARAIAYGNAVRLFGAGGAAFPPP